MTRDRAPDLAMGYVKYSKAPYVMVTTFGLILFGISLLFALNANQSKQWSSTDGIVQKQDGSSIVYVYDVAGTTYSAHAVSFAHVIDDTFHLPNKMDKPQGFEDQIHVTVHYDSMHPENAVLKPGAPGLCIIFVILGAAMTGWGLLRTLSGAEAPTQPRSFYDSVT